MKHEKTELPRPALHGVRRISVVRSSPESQYPEFFFVFCLFFIFSLRAVGEGQRAKERESKSGSTPSIEPKPGLDIRTLR